MVEIQHQFVAHDAGNPSSHVRVAAEIKVYLPGKSYRRQ